MCYSLYSYCYCLYYYYWIYLAYESTLYPILPTPGNSYLIILLLGLIFGDLF